MGEYTVPIVLLVLLIIIFPLAFNQVMRELRPHSRWFTQNRKPKVEAEAPKPYDVHLGRDYEPPIIADDLYDTLKSPQPWGAGQCASCGKFRKKVDLTTHEVVNHSRTESWYEPICRICRPDLFATSSMSEGFGTTITGRSWKFDSEVETPDLLES